MGARIAKIRFGSFHPFHFQYSLGSVFIWKHFLKSFGKMEGGPELLKNTPMI